LREECLEEELLWSRGEAQVVVDWWMTVYNRQRPHSSLGYETPFEYAARAALNGGLQGQTSNVLHKHSNWTKERGKVRKVLKNLLSDESAEIMVKAIQSE
jgi:hypothetical protein